MKLLNLNFLITNIRSVAVAFFSDFLFHFVTAGLLLFLAMIASIMLTLQKNFVSMNQKIYNQILKDFNSTIVKLKWRVV